MLKDINFDFVCLPLNSELHAIDNNSYLFRLPVDTKEWNVYPRNEWKQVSAASYFTWAVDKNGAVYVYVNHENISIRVKEETFENERWIPLKSFGKHLLPTDRYAWSNANGREKKNKEDISLPTSNWQWEGEWRVESTLNGELIEDNDCWTYALDFPTDYRGKYFWPCTVRRRKWYRIRYYTAVNKWSKIEPFRNNNNFEEAILNVSIGGQKYFDCHRLVSIFVWAVSHSGQVLYRNNVSLMNPEGTNWIVVSNPDDGIVKFISCGSYSLVWAVLRDGRLAVRCGVTIDNCIGTEWLVVPPPKNLEVISIGTGLNHVCVITNDNRVWWRKGIASESDSITEKNIIGSEWVQFGGPKMKEVSLSRQDTIWAIGVENNCLYFRSGIRDLKWHLVQTPVGCDGVNNDTLDKSNKFNERNKSLQEFYCCERLTDSIETIRIDGNFNTNGKGKTTSLSPCNGNNYWININAGAVISNGLPFCCRLDKRRNRILNEEYSWRAELLSSLKARPENKIQFKIREHSLSILPVDKLACCQCSFDKKNNFKNCIIKLMYIPKNLENVDYVGYLAFFTRDEQSNDYFSCIIKFEKIRLISNESVLDFPCMVIHTEKSIEQNTDRVFFHFFSEIELLDWFCLLQQACCEINKIDPICSLNPGSLWLTTKFGDIYVYDYSKLEEYRYAGLYTMDLYYHRFEDTNKYILYNGFPNNSQIEIYGYIPYGMKKIEMNLVNILNDDIILNVTAKLKEGILEMNSRIAKEWGQPKQTDLSFGSGNYFSFTVVYKDDTFQVCDHYFDNSSFQLKISGCYATHLTLTDGVDIHTVRYYSPDAVLLLSKMFWRKVDGYLSEIKTNGEVVWGLNEDYEPWIFTDINKADFVNNKMTCSKTVHVYENQRWNPIKSFSSPRLPTDRPIWSDETGQIAVNKESYKLPNTFWNWTSPWCIDYDVNNGTDNDGWQYAIDFPASYHSSKKITDFVRRRRWTRTRQLSIEAPWKKVPNLKLKEFCVPKIENPDGGMPIWALTQHGDVFIRKEVTKEKPMGSYWEKVSSPQPVICISSSIYLHVYICSEAGYIYKRWGITSDNPLGDKWACISSLSNQFKVKKIAVGHASIWAIDNEGSVFINTEVFDSSNYSETNWTKITDKVDNKFVNIAIKKNHVWAIDEEGYLYQRVGVCDSDLIGSFWLKAFMNNVQSING